MNRSILLLVFSIFLTTAALDANTQTDGRKAPLTHMPLPKKRSHRKSNASTAPFMKQIFIIRRIPRYFGTAFGR